MKGGCIDKYFIYLSYKNMGEKVWIALISAGTGALVVEIFKIVGKKMDRHYEKDRDEKNRKDKFLEKKEEVYLEALQRLLHLKEMLAYSYEKILEIPELKERMKENDEKFRLVAPKLRLYASDKIYGEYFELATLFFNKPPKAIVDKTSIENFDTRINILSRKMQEDLGYRKYDSEIIKIICPKCETEHDAFIKCPDCGMTYEETLKKQIEIIKEKIDKTNNS
jgi:hypothetical protein